ncbi:hypothetical protein Esti_001216 [Eimeria stiedai]
MQFSTRAPPQGRGLSISISRSRQSSLTPPGSPREQQQQQQERRGSTSSSSGSTPGLVAMDRTSPTRAAELWQTENGKTAGTLRRFPYMLRGIVPGATPNEVRNFLSKVGTVKEMYLPIHHLNRTPRSYCFFDYLNGDDGERAVKELHHQLFMGCRVTVQRANSDPKTPEQMVRRPQAHASLRERGTVAS